MCLRNKHLVISVVYNEINIYNDKLRNELFKTQLRHQNDKINFLILMKKPKTYKILTQII